MVLRKLLLLAVTLPLAVLTACGGGGGSHPATAYGPLTFDIQTNPGSAVIAAQITGQYIKVNDASFNWLQAQLPAASNPLAGMAFSPETATGAGFSGVLRATLDTERGTSAIVASQTVDVYGANVPGQSLAFYASVTTDGSGRFSLPLNFLGTLIFASHQGPTTFTVAAFADQASTVTGDAVKFHAIARGGTAPITYAWDFGDGGQDTGETTQHAYAAAGVYFVSVRATDALGAAALSTSTSITVTGTTAPLTGVTVAVTPGAVNSGTFDYAATVTGGKAPFTYFWDFAGVGSGADTATTNTAFTTHTFAALGLYNGDLTVTDALGATATANFTSDAQSVPVITSLSVTEAGPGDAVSVLGNHFGTQGAGDEVRLGGVVLAVDPAGAWTDTKIDVLLPDPMPTTANGQILVHRRVDSNQFSLNVLPKAPGAPNGGQY